MTTSSQREHIESIRAEFRDLAARPRDSLQNALEHLGAKLYSRKAHFLFELIQNADDNDYPPGVEPELVFELLSTDPTDTAGADGCLVVANNECGFERKHVDAICQLGKTTKAKAAGYIGEKGVGFKSVFQVSSRPHVVSNGYAFCFDEKPSDGAVGYICPTWLERLPEGIGVETTRIFLPLKTSELPKLRRELEEIHPSTLLFLRKLRRLRITFDGNPVRELRLEPSVLPEEPLVFVRLHASARASVRYWVYRHAASRPEQLEEADREGVTNSVITIALPLDEPGDEEGRVFVFLPTELRSGFPFIVNADFLTTPSRESILFERPWNLWLRDEVAVALVRALRALARVAEQPVAANREEFGLGPMLPYRLVPDPARVRERDFFLTVWEQARDQLREEAFVRCVIRDPDHYELRKPLDVLRTREDLRTLLLPRDDPYPELGTTLRLTHESLAGVNRALERLGVKEPSLKDLVPVMSSGWFARRSSAWFVGFYSYFAAKKWKPPSDVGIVPTASGLANATEVVYLASAQQDLLPASIARRFRLRVITTELAAALGESPIAFKWLRDHCRVAEMRPTEVIVNSILPEISDSDQVDLILRTTRYIGRHWEQLPADAREMVARKLPYVFTTEATEGEEAACVLPISLDPDGWQLVFPEPDDRLHLTVLSDEYLAGPERERQGILAVLQVLGATDTPPPRKTTTRQGGAQNDYERQCAANARHLDDGTVTNYRPPRWVSQLRAGDPADPMLPRVRALLRWLERWEQRRKRQGTLLRSFPWESAQVEWFYYRTRSKPLDSEIVAALKNTPWVPSTRGLQRPDAVFVDSDEVRRLFGDDVPYLVGVQQEHIGLLVRYGLNQSATPASALSYLHGLSQARTALPRSAAERLYRLVAADDRLPVPAAEEALVYLPDADPKWRRTTEVTWTDTSIALNERFPSLEKVYPTLRDLFVTRWKVPEDAPDEAYTAAWGELPASGYSPERVEAALERIYARLKPVARELGTALSELPIWTQDRVFADRPVYVPDDPDLRRLFLGSVPYAWRPEKRGFADFAEIYDALGVRWLTRSVRRDVIHMEVDREVPARLLTPGARRMLAYDLWNRWRDCWDEWRDAVVRLLRLDEVAVQRLIVRYELEDATAAQVDDHVVYEDDGRLLVAVGPDIEEARQEAAALLASDVLGSADRDVENALFRALTVKEEWSSKEIRRKRLRRPPDELFQTIGSSMSVLGEIDGAPEDSETGAVRDVELITDTEQEADVAVGLTPVVGPSAAERKGLSAEAAGEVDGEAASKEGSSHRSERDAISVRPSLIKKPAVISQVSAAGDSPQPVKPASETPKRPGDVSAPVREPRRIVEASPSFATWIIGLQRPATSERELDRPVASGGPRTSRAADEELQRARGLSVGGRVEIRLRREQVLTEVAADLRDRARDMLRGDYPGRCQVCGSTFIQANGDLDIVIVQWRSAVGEAGDLHYGNLLGLCAWHAALVQRGRFTLLDGESRPFRDEQSFIAFVRGGGMQEETANGETLFCLPIRFHNVVEAAESETRDHDARVRYCPPHWQFFQRLVAEDPGS
jgi:hypothetical protein